MPDDGEDHPHRDARGVRPRAEPRRRRDARGPGRLRRGVRHLSPRTSAPRTRSSTPRTTCSPRGTWATDEDRRVPPPVRQRDHRADPPRDRSLAEAVGSGRTRPPLERRHRTPLRGRQQPAPRRRPAGPRLRRHAMGHLPPDPDPGGTGPEGRARHPHPRLPGPPEGGGEGRAGAARQGRGGQTHLPPRAARYPPSSGSTPCSTPSRPTDSRPGRGPPTSRPGRSTGRPRGLSPTAGSRSGT